MRDKWKAIRLQIMELLLEVPCAEFMNTVNKFSLNTSQGRCAVYISVI